MSGNMVTEQESINSSIPILDKVLYEPHPVSVGVKPETEAIWSSLEAHARLVASQQEEKDAIANIGTDETRGDTFALSLFGLITLIAVIIGVSSTWTFNAGTDLGSKIFFCVFFGFLSLIGGAIVGVGLAQLGQKINFQFWKRSKEGKKLFALKSQKTEKIAQIQKEINEQSEQRMNEAYYFESLLKFDHMVQRIQKQYDQAFLCSDFFKHRIEFHQIRNAITEDYLNNHSVAMCQKIEEAFNLEKLTASLWDQFKKKDKNLLEQRYQEFAKDKTPEMINII